MAKKVYMRQYNLKEDEKKNPPENNVSAHYKTDIRQHNMSNFSYLTELSENITHLIVWFNHIRRQNKKLCIDLVPKDWLLKPKHTWLCQYPPKSDYSKVQEWSKECKAPELTWKKYPVKLLKDANNFYQGQRRMACMYEDTVLLSSKISDVPEELSDTETDDSNNNPDLEFETFSHQKIIKRRIMESDEDNDALTSSSESVILSFNSTKSLTQDSTAKKIKRKKILSLFDEAETSNTFKNPKSHNDYTRNNEFTQIIANACYEQVKTLIQKKMDNIKRSILYDMRKSFEELKNNLLLNLLPKDKINTISALKQIIEIKIPTSTLDEFKTLDALMEIDEKKDALRTLFEKYVYVTPTHKKAIHNTLSAVMDKEVQILFTAFGRRSESKKLNFSKTKIYSLLMDILISKFGTEEEKEINSSMSRWFMIAADRKGGRKEKENLNKITNSN